MSLDGNVMPGLLTALRGITDGSGNTLFASVDEGYTFDVGMSPAVWVTPASFNAPEAQGSDLEATDWEIEVKVLYEWANDQHAAETNLTVLIEPVRQALRQHIKMGQPTIARSRVQSGSWGWIQVNEVWFRTVDLLVAVREKEARSYYA